MTETSIKKRPPENALDFNMAILDSVWGKDDGVPQGLRDKLSKKLYLKDEATNRIYVEKEDLWALLGFYTRDMRLANISDPQLEYCAYYIDLANDLLQVNMAEPFLIGLSRSATVLELSQSRGGFLRRRQGTLTTENVKSDMEPGKRSIFTGKLKGR